MSNAEHNGIGLWEYLVNVHQWYKSWDANLCYTGMPDPRADVAFRLSEDLIPF